MTIDPKRIAEWKAREEHGEAIDAEQAQCIYDRFLDARTDLRRAIRDALRSAREPVPALLTEREEMLAVLRSVEWVEHVCGDRYDKRCPACGGSLIDAQAANERRPAHAKWPERTGHVADCRLAALLRGTTP